MVNDFHDEIWFSKGGNVNITFHMHTFIIYALISTHLTLPFIKTHDSWLFHITKIYTSKYIVKNSITRLQVISSYFDTTENSHNNMNIEITVKICDSLYY